MKTAQTNSNRIVGISSDDFFQINTKDNKSKNQKSQKINFLILNLILIYNLKI